MLLHGLFYFFADHVLDPETGGGGPAVDQEVVTGEGQDQEVGNVAVIAREGEVQERANLAVNQDQKAKVDLKHTVDLEVGHQMRTWMAQRKDQHQGHTVGAGQRVDQIDDETLDYCLWHEDV